MLAREGKVLDGRNRYRACTEIGIEPITKPWDLRGTALSYVISKNLHRRHLKESQRGMAADKIANLKEGRPSSETASIEAVSQTRAAKLLNVGRASVQRAHEVLASGIPELVRAVESGKVSVTAAAEIAKQPEEKQREIVMRGEKAIVEGRGAH